MIPATCNLCLRLSTLTTHGYWNVINGGVYFPLYWIRSHNIHEYANPISVHSRMRDEAKCVTDGQLGLARTAGRFKPQVTLVQVPSQSKLTTLSLCVSLDWPVIELRLFMIHLDFANFTEIYTIRNEATGSTALVMKHETKQIYIQTNNTKIIVQGGHIRVTDCLNRAQSVGRTCASSSLGSAAVRGVPGARPVRGRLERNLLLLVDKVRVVAMHNRGFVLDIFEEHVLVRPAHQHALADAEAQQRRVRLQELLHAPAQRAWRGVDQVCDGEDSNPGESVC